jgi:hypothetical protein
MESSMPGLQAPFDYKEEIRKYKRGVLDPQVAQYVRENPETNIDVIARRFGLVESTIEGITNRQGVRRGSGRRKKAL